MKNLIKKIFPLNRSLVSDDNYKTLKYMQKFTKKLKIKSFKSGKKVFDWRIPKKWSVKEAYIVTPDKKKICEYGKNNLHLVSYSKKIDKFLNLKQLKKFLHTRKDLPKAIPYITSYYKKSWGFCISYDEFKKLKKGKYKVVIDSNFENDKMHYGEILIKGTLSKEIMFSTYICHQSMANNELSGPLLSIMIANFLMKKKRRYTYRIIFTSETIGTIAYINKNIDVLKKNLLAGYILTCVGDERCFSFLPSRHGNTLSDLYALKIFNKIKGKKKYYTWLDRASDERQFCSPGIDLPVSSIMRSKYGSFKEYHTSLDSFGKVVTMRGLKQTLKIYRLIINNFEKSFFPISTKKCEPFMTKYKLYPSLNNRSNWILPKEIKVRNMMNFLSWSDGKNSIESISKKIDLNLKNTKKIFYILKKNKLISIQ